MKLGIFDSGIGGEAIASSLKLTFPDATILTVNDREHVPYGNKPSAEIVELTDRAIQPLLKSDCDVIIIACNTATAAAIDLLRKRYPHQKFIGLEPMIKTAAALTKSGTIAVCATPTTLSSMRYLTLIKNYGAHLQIIEPDCSQWAYWIENHRLNRSHIEEIIETICHRGADVIVLGCTHYHWIKDLIIELAAGRAQIIDPSEAISRRIEILMATENPLVDA